MDLAQLVTNYAPPSPRRSSYSTQQSRRPWGPTTSSNIKATPSPYTTVMELPPSPEAEPVVRYSLPPISTLFQDIESISPPQSAKRPRFDDWEEEKSERKYRMILPPTPPQRPESSFEESRRSPSTSSTPTLVGSSTLTSPASDASIERPASRTTYSNRSSFSETREARYPSPANSNVARFASPEQKVSSPELYPASVPAFRPVPAAQPQPQQPSQHHHHQMVNMGEMTGTTTWQHHHYFPPSNTAAYPLNHDRYICRTCNKAFSRPSSLRIHSHSHTGEKPFRCPRPGCGKAFSVRSNMKRHERGCHSGRAAQRGPHVG
ncbi:C2H2 finger domain-containing protein [Trichophyton equinum CBS 127.97]|uniref:C2H2 finger domain-containing protein n=1 Tax=Trichophyton equinum (strain ATCC MYA-4606 / CBS 127.97) TaxID=559882 RepID=F2Q054_TRIEC|nr:C2H2 finger domain-containing protein [Trichophyton equinum CBS 127.97]